MSIHAQPTPEALATLRQQQRRTSIGSLLIGFLAMILIGVILAIILIVPFSVQETEVVAYVAAETPRPEPPRPTQLPQSKPGAPSTSIAKVLAATAVSPVSIPVPDISLPTPSLDFGDATDFGEGWGSGTGGSGNGSSSGFGSTASIAGGLRGRLYDFKKNDRGVATNFSPESNTDYAERMNAIQRASFADGSFRNFFKAPQELSLTQVAIPLSNANEGPKFFKADIEPKGWLAHYQGQIVSTRDITFRFAGAGDDYLGVFINGRAVLHAHRPGLQEAVSGGWSPARDTAGKWKTLKDNPLKFGDWITLKAGQAVRLDLGLGERPGGFVGYVLLVEEQGVSYRKANDGRPILPLFATVPFSQEVRAEITAGFRNFQFEWDNVPIFPAR
jgi:hypothetical protein